MYSDHDVHSADRSSTLMVRKLTMNVAYKAILQDSMTSLTAA